MSSSSHRLLIRNMVCARCISAVSGVLRKLHLPYQDLKLGEVDLQHAPSASEKKTLASELEALGFALAETRQQQLITQIRKAVHDYVNLGEERSRQKLSAYIVSHIPHDYSYLSDLFSSVEGQTIEHFFMAQRMERVKELLVYDEQSLTQVAYDAGFSSVHHLSAQFKKLTGMTPTQFRKLATHNRKPLDGL